MNSYLMSLFGGLLIGLAVSLMLYLNGRVTGVSSIVGGTLRPIPGDTFWRWSFIAGLLAGGFILKLIYPESLFGNLNRSDSTIVIAGLLVGFGTLMGGGCTSGHGICGLSRFSIRSLVATGLFMGFGILSATFFRLFFAESL